MVEGGDPTGDDAPLAVTETSWFRQQWRPFPDAGERRRSNRQLLRAVLRLHADRSIIPEDAQWYVRHALWRHTELLKGRKYFSTPYRTQSIRDGASSCRFEHVVELAWLASRLVDDPQRWLASDKDLDGLLGIAVTCVVTKDEHDALGRGLGWERYLNARRAIVVLDCRHPVPVELDLQEAVAGQQAQIAALGL